MSEIYRHETRWGRTDEYEIVEKVPKGYFVWNIGTNMGRDDLVPFVMEKEPGNPDCFDIRFDNMKAVKMPESWVKIMRTVAGIGGCTPYGVEKALKSKDRYAKRHHYELCAAREIFAWVYED